MSTQAQPVVHPPLKQDTFEIRIVSHSNLFYWWPLWAVAFVLGFLSMFDGNSMAIVPKKAEILHHVNVQATNEAQRNDVDAIVAPAGQIVDVPHLHISRYKSYGVLFTIVLLLLIIITNVPLRGLWSVVVIVAVILLSVIFALAHIGEKSIWEIIFDYVVRLHIYINAAGYFLIAISLLIIWLVTFLLFDPQIYMIFTPGQLRVRQEIGGGEEVHDTAQMFVQKQRNDLFRHWILGLGSGDLIVNTSGAASRHFDLPNVLFVGYKVKQIEDMLREKPVVQG
jgi:hypothetical protein